MIDRVFAIDPGNEQSALAEIHIADDGSPTYRNEGSGKFDNEVLFSKLRMLSMEYEEDAFVCEVPAQYGIMVTKEVIETAVVTGRIKEITDCYLIPRKEIMKHLTGQTNLKDKNIIAALISRFARSERNYGKGTKKNPDYFHGIAKDVWQAFAVGITLIDLLDEKREVRR